MTVNGQFSTDLDLFYSEDDVKSLFDYESQAYKTVCDLTLRAMQSKDDTSEQREVNDLLLGHFFNYISEDKKARDNLYYVCTFNRDYSAEDQKLFSTNYEFFTNLFM